MQSLELKIPPIVLVILFTIIMWMVSLATPTVSFYFSWSNQLASILGVAGIIISTLGVIAFRRGNTTVDPRHPDQSSRLINGGVYRVSRNPMYLGFLFVLLAWAVYLSNGASFLPLPLFVVYMNRFQIIPEERFMMENFGVEYRSYAERVRRWL